MRPMPTPEVRRERKRVLVVAVVAVALSLLATISSFVVNGHRISENKALAVKTCVAANETRMELRNYFGFLEKITKSNRLLTDAEKAQRVAFYEESKRHFPAKPCN